MATHIPWAVSLGRAWDLHSQPGEGPMPLSLARQIFSHWTARKSSYFLFLFYRKEKRWSRKPRERKEKTKFLNT